MNFTLTCLSCRSFPFTFILLLACILTCHNVLAQQATTQPAASQADQTETKEQRDARMKWWREARFGMFIHWGVYSVPAGTYQGKQTQNIGEWIMRDMNIPVAEYAEYTKQFNPVKFNADQWVTLAKNAGMKYIVITSKHHDGFAMFHSQASPFNIFDATPFKRDPIKELAEACQKNGIKLGFYYSQAQDWNHPGGAAYKKNVDKNIDDRNHWDEAQKGSFDDYLKNVALPQVKEILTNYGPIAVLWWDTPVDMNKERAELFLPLLKLQPGIITNNRLVHNVPGILGDTETPEQFIPATGFANRDWETCMTMNDTWGYKSFDNKWKSSELLIRNLIDIASKGGNYLLNVGPTAEGEIPAPSVERLKQIGDWTQANGEAIYGTTASPFRKYTFDGRVTVKGNKLFLHVFTWPADGIKLPGVGAPISATVLDGGAKVDFKSETDASTGQVLRIATPEKQDKIATVVALEFASPPKIDTSATAVHADADGNLTLKAGDAIVNGRGAKLVGDHIGNWTDPRVALIWDLVPKAAGKYQIEMTYGCPDASADAAISLSVGDTKLPVTLESTGGAETWKTANVGTIELSNAMQTITVRLAKTPKEALNLQSIKLSPAK